MSTPNHVEGISSSPLVTVVVSCFNYGHFLSDCLESVLAQTYKHWEIIVIDDGSTDNTSDVVHPYLDHSNITFFRRPHQGQTGAKNYGIQNAKGSFIAFLDADDMWHPSKLERQMKLFENPAVGVVYSRMSYIAEDGSKLGSPHLRGYLKPRRGRVLRSLFMDNFLPFSSTVARKECFQKAGMLNGTYSLGNDWDLWLRVSVHYEFDYVDEPLLFYRVGHNQLSKNLEMRHICAEKIMTNFLAAHPRTLSWFDRRRAWAYTYANRGYYYRPRDLGKSTYYYLLAIKNCFWRPAPLRGLIKNSLIRIGSMEAQ